MKWSELDELVVEAARIVVEQNEILIANLQQKLGIEYTHAGRLMDQLEALKIVTPYDGNKIRHTLFSKVDAVEVYLNELRSLEEFTQADIDRYNYMRSVDHWKEYEDPLLALNFLDDGLSGEVIFNRLMNGNDSGVAEHLQPQLAFKRSAFQRVLYSTWLVGAISLPIGLMLVVLMIEWRVGSKLFYENPFLEIGLLIVTSVLWQPAWKKHLRSPIELYWVGDHFEAVFPDGTLDRKPDLSEVLYYQKDGKTREGGWLSLSPTSKYFGANWEGLKECHQAWMNAQKEE